MAEDATKLFGPRPEALFSGDSASLTGLEMSAALSDFRGIAVTTPKQLGPVKPDIMPVVILSQRTALRAWQVPERYNLVLAVTGLDDSSFDLVLPLDDPKDAEPVAPLQARRPPEPTGAMADAVSTKAQKFDIHFSGSGRIVIAAIAFDAVSNISVTDVPRIAATTHVLNWTRPNPTSGLPSFVADGSAPVQQGLTFELRVREGGSPTIDVRGRFRKLLMPAERLPAAQIAIDNGQQQQVVAAVPVQVVMLRLNGPPKVQTLVVPLYGRALPQSGQQVNGVFAIRWPAEIRLTTGRYAAYVIMDGRPYGPRIFELR